MKRVFVTIILFGLVLRTELRSQVNESHDIFAGTPLELHLSASPLNKNGAAAKALFESAHSPVRSVSSDRIVFAGRASQSAWVLEVSENLDQRGWTEWSPVELHWHEGGRFWAKAGITKGFQTLLFRFRIVDRGSQGALDLKFFSIECITSQLRVNETVPISLVPISVSYDTLPAPPMVSRSDWGAAAPNGAMVVHTPFRGAIHHTAEVRVTTLEQGKAEMRFMQDLHMNGNGWKDIGYHYCIDDSGRIYQGTDVRYLASHADNNNTGNVGISFMGDFTLAQPTQKALKACTDLLSYLSTRYPIRTDSIFGHLDYVPSTTCPGAAAYALLPELRNSIRQMLSGGAPYVKSPQPLPFATTVSPSSSISFLIRDDLEGVQPESLVVSINNAIVTPMIQAIDANEIRVSYTPAAPFDYSTLVPVDIRAQDRAVPPHTLSYHYQFRTKAQTISSEMTSGTVLTNAVWTRSGLWTVSPDDALISDLSDGMMMYARDSLQDHSVVIHPNIKESGNYLISLVLPRQELGLNARYVVRNSLGIQKEELIEYNRNFEKAWYQLGTGAVYFEAGTPSNGSIEIQPMPGFTTTMMLDAIKLEKQDMALPPDVPELKSVRLNSAGKIEVQWYPSLEGGLRGFRVIKSADGVTWSDTVANESVLKSNDSLFVFSPPPGSGVIYCKIVSVDTQKTENLDGKAVYILSDPSDTYGTTYGMPKKILLVDNFDRIGSWPLKQHSFIRNFGNAIGASTAGWETAVNDAVATGDVKLDEYSVVMYMCGDDSDRDESVSNIELLRIRSYLEQGGSLFISGSEIGYDLGRPGRPDIPLYNSILKASYLGDDSGVRTCVAAAGSSFQGLTFDFGAATNDTYIEEFPDYIASVNGSQPVLYYQNSTKVAGVAYTGSYGSSSFVGRLLYLAFPFETIAPASSRSEVMKRVLSFFGIAVGVDAATASSMPSDIELQQNFPNPFNPATVIRYRLPIAAAVSLKIFNTLGQLVAVLVDERKDAGDYQVQWNADVPSGIYFYRLSVVPSARGDLAHTAGSRWAGARISRDEEDGSASLSFITNEEHCPFGARTDAS